MYIRNLVKQRAQLRAQLANPAQCRTIELAALAFAGATYELAPTDSRAWRMAAAALRAGGFRPKYTPVQQPAVRR